MMFVLLLFVLRCWRVASNIVELQECAQSVLEGFLKRSVNKTKRLAFLIGKLRVAGASMIILAVLQCAVHWRCHTLSPGAGIPLYGTQRFWPCTGWFRSYATEFGVQSGALQELSSTCTSLVTALCSLLLHWPSPYFGPGGLPAKY